MRIRWAALASVAGLLAFLAGCAGEVRALPPSSLVIARPTASPETFPLQLNAAVKAADASLQRLVGLLQAPHYLDDAWREEVVNAATLADLAYRQITELAPPDNQREKYEAAAQALNGCQDLASFAVRGINNLDKGPFDEIAARAVFCRSKLEVAMRAPGSAEARALPESIEQARQSVRFTVMRDANVRSGPGTSHSRVATAAPGDQLTINGRTEKGDWLRISGSGTKEAWIAAFLGRIEGDLQGVPVAP